MADRGARDVPEVRHVLFARSVFAGRAAAAQHHHQEIRTEGMGHWSECSMGFVPVMRQQGEKDAGSECCDA